MVLFWFMFEFCYWKTYQKCLALFYWFWSYPDNAKNESDPITDPITGSALIEIEICTLHEFLYNIFLNNLMMLLHFQDCYAPKYFYLN